MTTPNPNQDDVEISVVDDSLVYIRKNIKNLATELSELMGCEDTLENDRRCQY